MIYYTILYYNPAELDLRAGLPEPSSGLLLYGGVLAGAGERETRIRRVR